MKSVPDAPATLFADPGATFCIEGDRTGATRPLVYADNGRIAIATEWRDLIQKINLKDLRLRPTSAALLLRCGFIPCPYTLYEGIYQLAPGDTLTIDKTTHTVLHKNEFPFLSRHSHQSNTWNTDEFSARLCQAVDRAVRNEPVSLLLSAGKDSTALLWALRELGKRDVTCVTYDAGYREQEAELAGELARNFGFRHIVVAADPITEFVDFMDFLKSCPHPTLDFALPAALAAVKEASRHGSVVLDGCGNDRYMYYSPNRRERILRALSISSRFDRAWAAKCPILLRGRAAYVWSSIFMYRAERWFPGPRLSADLIRHIAGVTDEVQAFVRNLDLDLARVSQNVSATIAKGRFSDFGGGMEKTRLASEHYNVRPAYPFCDADLANYYFHLPEIDRFDRKTMMAKIAFKNWLECQGMHSHYFSVKGSFRYNMRNFFDKNFNSVRIRLSQHDRLLTKSIMKIFENARNDYVSAQYAYLIFGLIYWADAHGYDLTDRS